MFIFIILFSVVIGHHFLLLFEIVELMQSSMKVFFLLQIFWNAC